MSSIVSLVWKWKGPLDNRMAPIQNKLRVGRKSTSRVVVKNLLARKTRVRVLTGQSLVYVFFTRDHGAPAPTRRIEFSIEGAGASVLVFGFNVGRTGNTNTAIELIHTHRDTRSACWIQSVLAEDARSVVDGFIRINKDAALSDAYFSHRSLLVSPRASAVTKPQLEILTNNVKAAHAAVVGRLDEDALFYVQSRGITMAEARRLTIDSFLCESLVHLEDSAVQQKVLTRIRALTRSIL